MMAASLQTDVLVIGAGNAAFAAAHAAREQDLNVLMLECAPRDEAGGNTRFTAGAMRFAYRGVEDLVALMPDLTEEELARTDFGAAIIRMWPFEAMNRVPVVPQRLAQSKTGRCSGSRWGAPSTVWVPQMARFNASMFSSESPRTLSPLKERSDRALAISSPRA